MSRLSAIAVVAAGLLALAEPPTAHAQGAALQRRLAAAKELQCSFTAVATGNWTGTTASAAVTGAKFEIKFSAINVDEGTADADGGFGAAYISVRYSHGYLHLMQMSDAGPLHVTTVFAAEAAPGRFKAVQTRHEYSPTVVPGFTSRPEMYVGDCALK